jgi:hypothetical protein
LGFVAFPPIVSLHFRLSQYVLLPPPKLLSLSSCIYGSDERNYAGEMLFLCICVLLFGGHPNGELERISSKEREGRPRVVGYFCGLTINCIISLSARREVPARRPNNQQQEQNKKKKKKELLLLVYLPDLVIQETGSPRPTTGIGAATQTVQQRNTL